MKTEISTTFILTEKEAKAISDTMDILRDMAQMIYSTDTKEQEKINRALDALGTVWYSGFVDVEE